MAIFKAGTKPVNNIPSDAGAASKG